MDNKVCFVIAPIGEPDSDTRKRSDQVLKYIITPAVGACGYSAVRADQISEPGIITSQVIQHVVDDPLVVADLTDRNPNVFYELALRHALKKPLVQLIRKGEPLPFDVAGTRTISIDHRDLESVELAKKEITSQVRAIEKTNIEIDTPISVALDLQLLKHSDNPEQRSLADMLAAMSEIRASIAAMEKQLAMISNDSSSRELTGRFTDYLLHDPNFFRVFWTKSTEGSPKLSVEQLDALMDYLNVLRHQATSRTSLKTESKKIPKRFETEDDTSA